MILIIHYSSYLLTFWCDPLERGLFSLFVVVNVVVVLAFSLFISRFGCERRNIRMVVRCGIGSVRGQLSRTTTRVNLRVSSIIMYLAEWVRLLPWQRHARVSVYHYLSHCENVCDRSLDDVRNAENKVLETVQLASVVFTTRHAHKRTRFQYSVIVGLASVISGVDCV